MTGTGIGAAGGAVIGADRRQRRAWHWNRRGGWACEWAALRSGQEEPGLGVRVGLQGGREGSGFRSAEITGAGPEFRSRQSVRTGLRAADHNPCPIQPRVEGLDGYSAHARLGAEILLEY